ncbi:hypothetical protein [Chitinophaga cymbidii]|uniref:hypothetical protein n=1 Tax=Chitinophaga cymbidii TaxID=1096750 RepID=UPI0011BE0291|nr:hypothetical protein [Chitinophaga cymbidii]
MEKITPCDLRYPDLIPGNLFTTPCPRRRFVIAANPRYTMRLFFRPPVNPLIFNPNFFHPPEFLIRIIKKLVFNKILIKIV